MSRRHLLVAMTVGSGLLGLTSRRKHARGAGQPASQREADARDYLQRLLLTRDDVEAWLAGKAFPFSRYDAELGYLHIDRDFQEGIDGAICRYRYDRLDARRTVAYADQPCRINTYGNSFTSCEQVSDGETWQEFLAAHLGEPVRNYGIGGYSVYQAYLRMLSEERRVPARYIVFNVFDDDHYRNLHGWQRIRFGVNRKSTNPTVPYVVVDPEKGDFVERPNPCPTPESVYQLCDRDAVYRLFHDDFVLETRLAREARRSQGQSVPAHDYDDPDFNRHALFATLRILDKVEAFAAAHERHVLYVLSYSPHNIQRYLEQGDRFDQPLVDYLEARRRPYVDLLKAHAADYAGFRLPPAEYLARYFIGHYNPLGNFFCARAMKDKLVEMLDPKPPAYAR
jgi:hypothetical protein